MDVDVSPSLQGQLPGMAARDVLVRRWPCRAGIDGAAAPTVVHRYIVCKRCERHFIVSERPIDIAADDPARFFYLGQSIAYIFECVGAAFLGRPAERLLNEKIGHARFAEEIRTSDSLRRG